MKLRLTKRTFERTINIYIYIIFVNLLNVLEIIFFTYAFFLKDLYGKKSFTINYLFYILLTHLNVTSKIHRFNSINSTKSLC